MYGPGTPNPLLAADGTARLVPAAGGYSVGERADLAVVATVAGAFGVPQARRQHQRALRRVTVRLESPTPAEAVMAVEAILVARGGCVEQSWRAPEDPPGPPETAPRWLLTGQRIERGRTGGAAGARIELVLEETDGRGPVMDLDAVDEGLVTEAAGVLEDDGLVTETVTVTVDDGSVA